MSQAFLIRKKKGRSGRAGSAESGIEVRNKEPGTWRSLEMALSEDGPNYMGADFFLAHCRQQEPNWSEWPRVDAWLARFTQKLYRVTLHRQTDGKVGLHELVPNDDMARERFLSLMEANRASLAWGHTRCGAHNPQRPLPLNCSHCLYAVGAYQFTQWGFFARWCVGNSWWATVSPVRVLLPPSFSSPLERQPAERDLFASQGEEEDWDSDSSAAFEIRLDAE